MMESAAPVLLRSDSRAWLLLLSIAAQQIVFFLACSLRIPLIAISVWVIYLPVVIIWVLYVVVPLFTAKRDRPHALLRAYALTGWIFVAAAVSWTGSYITLSRKYGTPVSWDEVQQRQSKANHTAEPASPNRAGSP